MKKYGMKITMIISLMTLIEIPPPLLDMSENGQTDAVVSWLIRFLLILQAITDACINPFLKILCIFF